MAINTDKTHTMLICSKQRQRNIINDEILNISSINGHILGNSKVLGVKNYCNLLWHEQVNHTCNTVITKLALLRRIKPYLNRPTLILFYNGYILPCMDYC